MAVFVSPGAYVREIDLSLYVPAIGQTIFGVVGGATKGAINTATFVSGQADFVRKFGNPSDDVGFGQYAMLQFLRRGTRGWYVRVGDGTEAPATIDILGAPTPATLISTPNTWEPVVTGDNDELELTTDIGGVGAKTITWTTTDAITEGIRTAPAMATFLASQIPNAMKYLGLDSIVTPENEVKLIGVGYARSATITGTFNLPLGTEQFVMIIDEPGATGTNIVCEPGVVYNSSSAPLGSTNKFTAGATVTVTALVDALNACPVFSAKAIAYKIGATTMTIITKTAGVTGTVWIDSLTNVGYNCGSLDDLLTTIDPPGSGDTIAATANTTWQYFEPTELATGTYPETATGSNGGTASITVTAKSPGTWGNALKVNVSPGNSDGTFKLQVYETKPGTELYYLVETWDGLVFKPAYADNYFVTRINDPLSGSAYITVEDVGTTDMPDGYDVLGGIFYGPMIGGLDGFDDITPGDYIGTNPSPTGLQIFRSAELIDVNLLAVPGVVDPNVISAMIEICETRGDAMCLVDPPLGLDVQTVVDWHNGAGAYAASHAAFNTSYAALYWPWVEIYDSYNDQQLLTPPSGHIAAVYAYNDYQRELWFAPAGLQRGFIPAAVRLETQSPSQGERDLLYGFPNNVNPIVSFTGQGIVVWGQKTLWRQPTAVDRVNVRRLLLYARKIIASTVRFLVFEPNDRTTWRAFINLVTPWLRNIQKKRGLLEFKVVCDETTNPPDQVDQSIMNGQIFLRPTKAAEVILVDFVLTNTGAKFEEAIY